MPMEPMRRRQILQTSRTNSERHTHIMSVNSFALRPILTRLSACALLLMVGACALIEDTVDDLTSSEPEALPGERVSVLTFETKLEADPKLAEVQVQLPAPYVNPEWPQPGGFANHAMHHLAADGQLAEQWTISIGKGSGGNRRLTATPIIAAGRIFALDAAARVTAFDAFTGERLWRAELTPEDEEPEVGFGGGVAFDNGRIFVTTGFGNVHALDAASGIEIWVKNLETPIRAAPTANGGRVFVSTTDNKLHALASDDGRILWDHRGIIETAGLLGSTSAAISGDTVIVPYSSGEVFAFRVQNGRINWSDSLTKTGRLNALSALNDIAGRPVIDRDRVIVTSHSGRTVSIDLRTGQRVWTRDIGSVQTPWVAGDYIYILTVDAELLCISRRDGRIRWLTTLPKYADEEDNEDPIEWSGPVLAGDRVIVVSSDGFAVSSSPYTGDVLSSWEMPDGAYVAPIVANQTIYFLTDKADLIAMR